MTHISLLHAYKLESDHYWDVAWIGTRQRRQSPSSDEGPHHDVMVLTADGIDDALFLV